MASASRTALQTPRPILAVSHRRARCALDGGSGGVVAMALARASGASQRGRHCRSELTGLLGAPCRRLRPAHGRFAGACPARLGRQRALSGAALRGLVLALYDADGHCDGGGALPHSGPGLDGQQVMAFGIGVIRRHDLSIAFLTPPVAWSAYFLILFAGGASGDCGRSGPRRIRRKVIRRRFWLWWA